MPNIFTRLSSTMKQRETKTEAAEHGNSQTAQPGSTPRLEDDATRLQRFLDCHRSVVYIAVGVFGSSGCGKKCMMCRLTRGIYTEAYDPTQDWNYQHNTYVLGHPVSMLLHPEDPLESVARISRNAFYFLTYNVGSRESFENMQGIYERVLAMKAPRDSSVSWCGGTVVALASDLASQPGALSAEMGREFAQARGLGFMETSAKTGFGCTEADFLSLTTRLLLQAADKSSTSKSDQLVASATDPPPPPPMSQSPPMHPPIPSLSNMDWPNSAERE